MPHEALGDLTAARVRHDGQLIEWLTDLTGLAILRVRDYLEAANGNTLVRNVFAQNWPVSSRALGTVRVSLARNVGLDTEIEKVTGLGMRALFKRLEAAHGNSTLATVFKDCWPAEVAAEDFDETHGADNTQDVTHEQTEVVQVSVTVGDLDALRLDTNGAWSRPRQLGTVLKSLKWEVPERLRTPRFHSLLAHLSALGVAIRPSDSKEPFSPDAASPGIIAQVCLRVTQSSDIKPQSPRQVVGPVRGGTMQDLVLPSPVAMVAAPSLPAPKHTAPKPLAPAHQSGTESDYDLCVERLQFLTAVPSLRRHRDPEWPSGYIAAAVEGLSIGVRERGLLEQAANDCVRGGHYPLPLVKSLVASRAHHDLDGLLVHFRRLNRDAIGSVEDIVRWVQEHKGEQHLPAPAVKVVPQVPARLAAVAATQAARSAPVRIVADEAPITSAAPDRPEPIVRNLGALDDMFED